MASGIARIGSVSGSLNRSLGVLIPRRPVVRLMDPADYSIHISCVKSTSASTHGTHALLIYVGGAGGARVNRSAAPYCIFTLELIRFRLTLHGGRAQIYAMHITAVRRLIEM